MADSRNEDLLENILGESNEYGEPQSRNEAILQNILGEQNELLPPVSRIETLLLQLKDAMPSGEIEITENGEYDVTGYETATVNVAGSGGITDGHTVTFKADGDDYYIASCQAGGTITEPPTPTSEKYFGGWKDEDNKPVTYPYTPNEDTEITALLSTYNFLVNSANGSSAMMTLNGANYTCTNLTAGNGASPDGKYDICGYVYLNGYTSPIIVTGVSRSNAINRGGYKQNATTPITYNGKTYYYGIGLGWQGEFEDTSGLNRYFIENATDEADAVTKLLNAFFAVS